MIRADEPREEKTEERPPKRVVAAVAIWGGTREVRVAPEMTRPKGGDAA